MALLTVLTICMSILEVVGVAGVLPFLSVLNDPTLLDTQPILVGFADFMGTTDARDTTIALGLAVFALVVVSMAVRALVTYAQIRFSLMRAYTVSARLLRGYLQQDYVWYLSRNTSDLGQSLLSEVDVVIRESVLPSVLVISNILIVFLIGGLLFLVEPVVAIGATGLLMSVYLTVFFVMRRRLGEVGKRRMAANGARFHVVQEVAGGLKEIKVMGLETQSLKRFRTPAREMARNQTLGLVIQRLPRFALEAATYGGFILMVLMLVIVQGEDIGTLLPLLGLIGMSATKLFPALQQMFQQLSAIRFSRPALARLHDSLQGLAPPQVEADVPPLRLRDKMELKGLEFRYPEGERNTLTGFNATIPAFTTLGIVGGTGAGKTTVIDMILGLLVPDAGEILVDGEEVSKDRIRAWQKSLGYVPQHIFLSDDTVAANIAFGSGGEIDMEAAERAARVANLHDFVMNEMPDGYMTRVGERGVRLSGGQRQRIGIARAMYQDPDVLILDEATSALDNLTERAVMDAVHALSGKKTVIMIAHRLSTVRACDMIFLLEGGKLAAKGSYDELVAENENFRRMASE
ncbi:ABC transporter ATP-binding protein [Rhodobacteraceae bacterium (ex Bugula neritina AB1)]|nr:ABC transporter ATP-binding protein [Rhodobacteraceae bacterium (ex Bugula neritina AB1)]